MGKKGFKGGKKNVVKRKYMIVWNPNTRSW